MQGWLWWALTSHPRFFSPHRKHHTQKAQRTTRITQDTLRNFPHRRLATPGSSDGTSAVRDEFEPGEN